MKIVYIFHTILQRILKSFFANIKVLMSFYRPRSR